MWMGAMGWGGGARGWKVRCRVGSVRGWGKGCAKVSCEVVRMGCVGG